MANRIRTGALAGIDGLAVTVETDICRGLPGFHVVGLPNAAVRESRERVLSALRNSGLKVPLGKITVNLAPAGVRKEGASFDLAIAMGVLGHALAEAEDEGAGQRSRALFLGELSLFGDLRPVRGLLSIVLDAVSRGEQLVVVPASQVAEARLVGGAEVVGANTLREVVDWWRTGREPAGVRCDPPLGAPAGVPAAAVEGRRAWRLLRGLQGQALVRKAAIVAAAGGHNLLLVGPPGAGKTRLARLMGKLQPPLTAAEGLEATRIHSAAGAGLIEGLMTKRPFRAPHHTITRAGLIGGGASLRPGEATLAHRGILFLDELTEFGPAVLDSLREPLEDGSVTVVRGSGARSYPAQFQLIAAMNPCRCGFRGSATRECRCSPAEQARYLGRLSGPLLDRFDLFVEVGAWRGRILDPGSPVRMEPRARDADWRIEPTADRLRSARVLLAAARRRSGARSDEIDTRGVSAEALDLLESVREPLNVSLRGLKRCLRVARTIAALDDRNETGLAHVREALEFRAGNTCLAGE